MNVLGLFSGIGGFELGFQRAGFNIAAMCEIEPYAAAVLRKHWPGVPVYPDVRELGAERLRADGIHVDVITGGFPCQDISLAGKGAGLAGARSGLWSEYLRIIEEVRPAWVVIENVSALRSRGLDVVLGQLATIRYDAEWHCVSASAVGAPHRRDRIWIVAYPEQQQLRLESGRCSRADGAGEALAAKHGAAQPLADTARDVRAEQAACRPERERIRECGQPLPRCDEQWFVEPNVGRVADGVPAIVDRLRAIGNAVVPQIPEMIARGIRHYEFFA